MRYHLKPALLAALATVILSFPILGLKLKSEGMTFMLEGANANTQWGIAAAIALVFFFQLFREPITALFRALPRPSLPLPKLNQEQAVRDRRERVITTIVVIAALIWPFTVARGSIDLATLVLIYVMLGLGLNIVVGLAGLLDLGYVAFYAVGAYSYALLSQYFGLSFWVCLPLSGLFAAIFGFLLGFPVLRLRGDYLAIVTLGFGEIIRILLLNMTSITGGPNGIGSIAKPSFFGMEFSRRASEEGVSLFHEVFHLEYSPEHRVIFLYLLALVLVLVTLFVIRRLIRMPVGRAWEALREDEIACRSLGLNRTAIKLSAFTLGATFAGFAGCFFATRQGFISPESFTFIESAIVLAIVVLGGMGSQLGIVLAAAAMTVLPELAREFNEYRMLFFGLLMVFMMIWRPQGLLPMQRPHVEVPHA